MAAVAQPAARQFLLRYEPVRKDFTLQNMTDAERPVVAQHGAYLKSLFESGKLMLAGQVLDPNGLWGILIVHAADEDAAKAIATGDPGVKAKIFRVTALPFSLGFAKTMDVAPGQ
jgi:uncharacterized protein YciI